jgi:uncharacterized membrane protein YqaE (UPF0057 family)
MSSDPNNINAQDPSDYVYVSKKHWARKQNILNGNDKITGIAGRPGPITGLILSLFDIVVTLFLKLMFNLFNISRYSFEWINNLTFGNFAGIIPSSLKKGKVISMKFFRYTMTVLMPPFGVLLSKGLYGWFNILVCMVITYISFIAGIIYAFVITSHNRYADQYEEHQLKKDLSENPDIVAKADASALMSTVGVFVLFGFVIYFFIGFF